MINSRTIRDHIVILGWSPRVNRIISELRNETEGNADNRRPILIVTEEQGGQFVLPFEHVYVMHGNPRDPEVLRRANLAHAHTLLIPTMLRDTSVSDGETVFALLAALSVNPQLRACVEIAQNSKRCDLFSKLAIST